MGFDSTMIALSRRVAHADESEANPGLRVWYIVLDLVGPTTVTVSWSLDCHVIESVELCDMLILSQTPEIFAGMLMEQAEELVGEPMAAHVSNCLRREIVHWHGANRRAIGELLRVHCGAASPRLPLTL
jgi:hypothetical protein